ncbi:MAG: Signaling protein ykoW [Frankiales bacterium]|nr:Signaling protein ykoW [Frankiales bacterium]
MQRPVTRVRLPLRYGLSAVAVVVWFLAMRLSGTETRLSQWVSNAGLVTVTVLAAGSCLHRARRAGAARRAWVLLGLGALSWGLGQAVWTFYESVEGRAVPFPSWADAGYLAAVPFLVSGLLSLPGSPTQVSTRVRLVLDGLVVSVSLGMVSWELVLADTLKAGGDTPFAAVISLLYPVGDVVCGTVALVALARARHGTRVPVGSLLLLCGGCTAFAVGDSGFAYLTLHGRYFSGHPIDLGWFVGFTLLGLAARVPARAAQEAEQLAGSGARAGVVAPYVAVLAALTADVVREVGVGRLGPFLAWGTMVLVGLLVVRQVLALQENASLTRELEARVAARTSELTVRTSELAGQELWFRSLVQNLSDVVTVVDEDFLLTYVTPSSAAHFGHAPASLQGVPLLHWWAPLDAARLQPLFAELRREPGAARVFTGHVRHAAGHLVPVEATVTSLGEEQAVRGYVLNVRDVTERRALELELSHQAFHDTLTGLANRSLFADRVEHALVGSRRSGTGLAVLFLDLDGFKAVNDTLGHGAGDRLLTQVAQRLTGCVRPGDTVARLGGDEFAVLLEDLVDGDDGSDVATRIAEALRAPVALDGRDVLVRSSCGIALLRTDETADELMRNADLAMYRAKASGGDGHAVFEPGMHLELVRRLQLEEDLRHAVERQQLEVWYQPTFALASGDRVGCEALVRWRHPVRGLVGPDEFIPVAEELGLIVELGAWVLREACRQTAVWRAGRPELAALDIAVNVSSRQLDDPGFLATVDAALADAGLPGSGLTIELTESVLVEHDEQMQELLAALKRRGVRLAIDDFGTGYSSLSYLHRFPVDVLKVDRSFVSGVAAGSDEEELTRTIVRLGQSLGLVVVAEGIEEAEQLQSLQVMGCDLGQGFLFSRPVPAGELEAAFDAVLPSQPTGPPPLLRVV